MIGFGAVDRNRLFPDVQSALPKAWCQVQVNQGVASFFERYHVPSATGIPVVQGASPSPGMEQSSASASVRFFCTPLHCRARCRCRLIVPPFAASFVSWVTLNGRGDRDQHPALADDRVQVKALDGLVKRSSSK